MEIDPILQSGDWILFEDAHLASPAHTRAVEDLLLKACYSFLFIRSNLATFIRAFQAVSSSVVHIMIQSEK